MMNAEIGRTVENDRSCSKGLDEFVHQAGLVRGLEDVALASAAGVVGTRGIVHVLVARRPAQVAIRVEDDSPGKPGEVLPRLRQKFVPTKPQGMGTGLGLRTCCRIIEEMSGIIAACDHPAGGARFEIVLPAAATGAA